MRIKKFQPGTRLEITWNDIVSDSAWQSKDDIDKAFTVKVKTVGYFLQNQKGVLKIAHSISEDGDSDSTRIPWAVIQKIDIWPLDLIEEALQKEGK